MRIGSFQYEELHYLYRGIAKYFSGKYESDEVVLNKAKAALRWFQVELVKLEPSKKHYDNSSIYIQYIHYLILMRKYFKDKQYPLVCNELGSLMYRHDILDPRIYHNLVALLNEFL